MSNTTMIIHDVEEVLVKPVTHLKRPEGQPQNTHSQDVVVKTIDGSVQTFSAIFCDAVNERLQREANSQGEDK